MILNFKAKYKFIFIFIFIFILLIFTNMTYAKNQGMVLVYEAPLFNAPNIEAKVIQKIKRGKIIYIHPKFFFDVIIEENAVIEKNNYKTNKERKNQEGRDGYSERDFYITYDNNGNESYILKNQVKLIYEDAKELEDPAPSYNISTDPTDFRIKEPIADNFPLYKNNSVRSYLTIGTGTQSYESYAFKQVLSSKKYGTPKELVYALLMSANFDKEGLYYFGGIIIFNGYSNNYFFTNYSSSKESYSRFGIGPYFSYDFYQIGENHSFTLFTSPIIYINNQVEVRRSGGPDRSDIERRVFKKRILSLRTGIIYQRKKLFSTLDFIMGGLFELSPSNTMEATEISGQPAKWNSNDNDNIKNEIGRNFSTFIGLQIQL
ncbi:MAG: hypothetical protein HQK51_08795 [Oligoflexia bacterium]|nr:hypothetical protein [Oligoflexia bacterium]